MSDIDSQYAKKIGRYVLVELLGKGAMGEVWRAVLHGPAGFQKTVAVKLISDLDAQSKESVRQQLINEARLGALLKHPNVVETYDLGEEDGNGPTPDHRFGKVALLRRALLLEPLAEYSAAGL